ncbi:MAG TPA: ATP-binding protein [Woeseiaceae bacterium]|nr:ATP-binding protein [Woeseiaceae bacterium]
MTETTPNPDDIPLGDGLYLAIGPEGFYRQLVEAAPDAMVVVDGEGRIVVVNEEAEKMFGRSRAGMLGRPVEMLLPERFRERHLHHRTGYTDAPKLRGMGAGMELAGLRADGSEFPVEVSLSPIRVPSGTFVASAIRDVTERKLIERELREARTMAERAQKANSAFLAAASHDLRQPVQALRLLAGALRRTVKEPLALEMVANQQESLEGMTNLLNSLLDVSRLDAGALQPNVREFPLQDLLDRFASEWTRQARHKQLALTVEPCPASVRSDPDLLAEILQNFVSNAVRYTQQGAVRIAAAETGDTVDISVIDTGIGIAPDQLENIFREFYQVRTPARKREGFGLGLAITHRLADLLGHGVAVTSVPGEGSTFTVRVPRSGNAVRTGRGRERAAALAPAAAVVLLIEDDATVAAGWQLLLRAAGYRTALADSAAGAEAVAAGLDEPPRLIISDYHLAEGSNGVDAVTRVRSTLGVAVPAYVVTGDTSKILEAVAGLENSRVMNKPVEPEELLRLAGETLASGVA